VDERAGGRERAKAIVAFACVLGLDGADKAAVGAMAGPLQQALRIGKTDLGLLLTCSVGVAAVATLPFGWLVDRVNRVRLLTWTVASWGVAMALSGFATTYTFLLLSRLLLGGATAAAGPAIASLIGDYFQPGERGSIYSQVLSGEIVGSGVGFLLAGELASWTWRAGFVALAVPAALVAWGLRYLPEPEHGGAGRLPARTAAGSARDEERGAIRELLRERGVRPRANLVLHEDPRQRSLWWAVGYVLEIPTNVVLIIASALGYFYFTGLRAFGVEYLHQRFDVGHAAAVALVLVIGTGALAGVLVSGRTADALVRRGRLRARVIVAVAAELGSAGLFLLALTASPFWVAVPLLVGAAAMLGSLGPPLDAARLDIMRPGLWGRAEAVRTCLRKAGEAISPLAFGYFAQHVFAGPGGGSGLQMTMLVMTAALFAGGAVALVALRTSPRDVATAEA